MNKCLDVFDSGVPFHRKGQNKSYKAKISNVYQKLSETRMACIRDQSHYIEVALGDIFMEQKMRFELVLGRLAILKKKLGVNYEQLLRVFFLRFHGQKNNLKLKKK